jgi:hypothetical protein
MGEFQALSASSGKMIIYQHKVYQEVLRSPHSLEVAIARGLTVPKPPTIAVRLDALNLSIPKIHDFPAFLRRSPSGIIKGLRWQPGSDLNDGAPTI